MKNGWLKENIGPNQALVTVIGTFALFGLAFFLKVDGANEKVLFMVIGALSEDCQRKLTPFCIEN